MGAIERLRRRTPPAGHELRRQDYVSVTHLPNARYKRVALNRPRLNRTLPALLE